MTSMVAKPGPRLDRGLAAILVLLFTSSFFTAQPSQAATPAVHLINNFDRDAVIDAYSRQLKPTLSVPIGWTGDVNTCNPGSTSKENRSASLAALNYVRAMADLPPVSESSTLSKYAQAGALITTGLGYLTHYPSSKSKCFTKAGYKGNSSGNIAFQYGGTPTELSEATGARAILAYMKDYGDKNRPVGHRRWLLYPRLTQVGLGDTHNANTTVVMGGKQASPKSQWITWPTAGYFPRELEPEGRWSISHSKANFKNASVSVSTPDGRILDIKRTIKNGYGDNTLAWDMTLPPNYRSSDDDYEVTVVVSKILVGTKYVSRTYRTTFVDADPELRTNPVLDTPDGTTPLRPRLALIGVKSCTWLENYWKITLSFALTKGSYIGTFNEQSSGQKTINDRWVIDLDTGVGSPIRPTGSFPFITEGRAVKFYAMNGVSVMIDQLWLPDVTVADLTNRCR
jgi:uncharacterized protein YkwD